MSRGEPDLGEPAHVVLVRHGTTDFTTAGRITGRGGADPGLNEAGRDQAARTAAEIGRLLGAPVGPRQGRRLGPQEGSAPSGECVVVSSALARARQTAAPIAAELGVPAQTDGGWDEQDAGEWDGLTWAEIAAARPGAPTAARAHDSFGPPGGETRAQMSERVLSAWARWNVEATVAVIVSHRGPIELVLGELLRIDPANAARLTLTPGGFTTLRCWRDGGVAVDTVNATAHLKR